MRNDSEVDTGIVIMVWTESRFHMDIAYKKIQKNAFPATEKRFLISMVIGLQLHIKPEQHNIAVLYYIVFPFDSDQAFFFGCVVSAAGF